MKAGSWSSLALIYLYGVMASASLSKIIPLQADLALHLGATPIQFGWLVSMLTIPAAILATVAGSIIDRIGARSALIAAACFGVMANFAYLQVHALPAFQIIRVLEGFVMVCAYSAAPALIMATMSDARRGRAMAVWSTYTPVGISLGLLLSANFAGTANWRGGYLLHLILFAVLVVAGFALPQPQIVPGTPKPRRAGLFAAWTQPGPLRVAITFAMLVVMGFGLNTVFPAWFAAQHAVPVGQASRILAMANLAMIPGGLCAGWMLARGVGDARVFGVLMLVAAAISVPLFAPATAQPLRIAVLVAWLVMSGAAIAVVTSALPRVVADARQGAAAAGLLSQIAALVTFVTPQLWLPIAASNRWPLFTVVVAVAGLTGWLLFPRHRPPPMTPAPG